MAEETLPSDKLFTVRSSEPGVEMRVELEEPDDFKVTLIDKGLTATARGWFNPDLGEPGSLIAFIEDIARCWRGWEGAKEWKALEAPFAISATHDRIGHISLKVSLSSGFYGQTWDAAIRLLLDAGTLDELAAEAKRVLKP